MNKIVVCCAVHYPTNNPHVSPSSFIFTCNPTNPPTDNKIIKSLKIDFSPNDRLFWAYLYQESGIDTNKLIHIK